MVLLKEFYQSSGNRLEERVEKWPGIAGSNRPPGQSGEPQTNCLYLGRPKPERLYRKGSTISRHFAWTLVIETALIRLKKSSILEAGPFYYSAIYSYPTKPNSVWHWVSP